MRSLVLAVLLVLGAVQTAGAQTFFTSENYFNGKIAFDKGDYEAALASWTASAEQGYPEALGLIGGLYHAGLGVEQDYAKAMELYLQAAEKGVAQAQLGIGNLYGDGLGVDKDYVKARMWFMISSNAGNERAEYNAGKVAQRMTEAEIDKADQMALEWIKANQ